MTVIVQRPVGFASTELAPDTFLIRTTLAAADDTMIMYQ